MTSVKRGFTTARRLRRVIGSAALGLALVLVFTTAAFSGTGGPLQEGKYLATPTITGDPLQGSKASIIVNYAPTPEPNSCVIFSSMVEALDSQAHVEVGLAKCGANTNVGTLQICKPTIPGHLYKFVETESAGSAGTKCYFEGEANVGSYYTFEVKETYRQSHIWEAAIDGNVVSQTPGQGAMDGFTSQVQIQEWGEYNGADHACTGPWTADASFKDWKRFVYDHSTTSGDWFTVDSFDQPNDVSTLPNEMTCASTATSAGWYIEDDGLGGINYNPFVTPDTNNWNIWRYPPGGGGCAVRRGSVVAC